MNWWSIVGFVLGGGVCLTGLTFLVGAIAAVVGHPAWRAVRAQGKRELTPEERYWLIRLGELRKR